MQTDSLEGSVLLTLVSLILPALGLFLLPVVGLGNVAAAAGFLILLFGGHLMHRMLTGFPLANANKPQSTPPS